MADEKQAEREPKGFSEHTRRSPSENAHQQGWGINEDERRKLPEGKQAWEGGTDYDYGAQDFGDTAADTSGVKPAPEAVDAVKKGSGSEAGEQDQRTSASRG